MDTFVLIIVIAALTYATRVSGFLISQWTIPPAINRFLAYVPVAVFAALVTPNIGIGASDMGPRLLGIIAATIITLRVRQLWAGITVGMAAYWVARFLL